MPDHLDTTCPFCGARFETGATSCPACDLPLLGADGSHPPPRHTAPFDGAALFDDGEAHIYEQLEADPRERTLATQSRGGAMRCVVVAMNEAEADMLGDMLRAEGVPCIVRTVGPHAYQQMSARCEVLVPEYALGAARQLLRISDPPVAYDPPSPQGVAMAIFAGLTTIAAAIALILAFA